MNKFRMMSLLGLVAAAGACRSPEGPYLGKANPNSLETAGAPVVVLNYDLSKRLAVDTRPVVARNADGQLEVQAALRNRTDIDTLQLQVQTLFFNDAGAVLYLDPGSPAPWTAVTISPNQTYYYKARSLTPEAARYTVRVRYAKGAQ